MENNVLKDAKKLFSKLGMRLFIGTIINTVAQFGALAVFGAMTQAIPSLAESAEAAFIATMLPVYVIGLPATIFMIKRIPVQEQPVEKKKMSAVQILIAICMSYFLTILGNVFGLAMTTVIGFLKNGEVGNVLATATAGVNPIVLFIFVGVCAPIFEELLFRKFFMDRIAQYGEGVAIVMSGALFALFHGNLNQFVYAFLLGCFFGFVYMKTRNVVYPILMHAGVNVVGTVISTVYLQYSDVAVIDIGFSVLVFGMLIVGLISWIRSVKKFKLQPAEVAIEKGKKFSTCMLNVGMILFCAIWILTMIVQLLA